MGRGRRSRWAAGAAWAAWAAWGAAALGGGGVGPAEGAKGGAVSCGSLVKLVAAGRGVRLHSHEVAYGGGSGQQSVTGFPTPGDAGSFWRVTGAAGEPCDQGTPVSSGKRVRLQHSTTGRWLHSHLIAAPLSGRFHQEVSAYGGADQSNADDVWVVEGKAGGDWITGPTAGVHLKHEATGRYLTATGKEFGSPIQGHTEIVASTKPDTKWYANEGIYFPVRGSDGLD